MASSTRKIFQNKAVDGNYISTLGTEGMWTLSALHTKHPSVRQTRVTAARWGGWALIWSQGAAGASGTFAQAGGPLVGSLSQKQVGLWVALELTLHM